MSTFIQLCRLAATHHDQTGEWPREARLDAGRFHALAHDLSARDLRRVSSRLALRVRQTPGASVGGRVVVQLEDLRPESAIAVDHVAEWFGLVLPHPLGRLTFDQAFYPRCEGWGARGDAPLWEAMRQRLFRVPIPEGATEAEIAESYYEAANAIVGVDLRTAEGEKPILVPELSIGHGMSDGHVYPQFWQEEGIPHLVRRAMPLAERGH